jgi:hypothetical protein
MNSHSAFSYFHEKILEKEVYHIAKKLLAGIAGT